MLLLAKIAEGANYFVDVENSLFIKSTFNENGVSMINA